MPTVPRNTPTSTRIDRTPGVSSVSPQGAEGLGATASALGRLAAATGDRASAIAREGRALQGVFDAVGDTAVTLERVQRIRAAREVDEYIARLKTDVSTRLFPHTDPATGQVIPGTLDTPFSPAGVDGSEATGAAIATRKFQKEWMEDKNGPFAKMSPRAQEAFKLQAEEIFRPAMTDAYRRDSESSQLRTKAVDDQNVAASLDLLGKAAGDLSGSLFDDTLATGRVQYAMRQVRHLLVDPANTDPAQNRYRIPEGEATFKQKMREFDAIAAQIRVNALVQMADAVPVGTPEADARAQRLLDAALMSAKTGSTVPPIPAAEKPAGTGEGELTVPAAAAAPAALHRFDTALSAEQVAKVQEAVQRIGDERTRRTLAQRAQNYAVAKTIVGRFALNLETQEHMDAAMAKLPAPEQGELKLFLADTATSREFYTAEKGVNKYLANPTPANKRELDNLIGGFVSPEAQLYARDKLVADSLKSGDDALTAFRLGYEDLGLPKDAWDATVIPMIKADATQKAETFIGGIHDESIRNRLTLQLRELKSREDQSYSKASKELREDQDKEDHEVSMMQLEFGIKADGQGGYGSMDETERIGLANKMLRARKITPVDHDKIMKRIAEGRNEPAIAQDTMAFAKDFVGIEGIEELFKFDSATDRFDVVRKPKGPVKAMTDRVGVANWTDERGRARKTQLSVKIVRDIMNAAFAYQMKLKSPDAEGKAPPTLQQFLAPLFTPETNGTVRTLFEQNVADRLDEKNGLIRSLQAMQFSETYKALLQEKESDANQ